MKKFLLFIACLLSSIMMVAGNENDYFSINGGFLFPQTANFQFAYERASGYDDSVELFGEIGNKFLSSSSPKSYYWAGGVGYKRGIKRYKNSELRLTSELHAGAYVKKFYFGAGIGLEYTYTFRSGIQFVLQQKNQVNFLKGDTFKNGLLVGVKIPF